ncbi:MAG: alpha/beta hydrolase [Pseudomonadota bacterium]
MPNDDAQFDIIETPLDDAVVMRSRHYLGGAKTPVLCLPGLTRNAADFEDIAPKIAAGGRDVYAVSFRGRGASDRDANYLNYQPLVYRDDVLSLIDQIGVRDVILVGTSLGGIVTMLTNEHPPDRVKAAVLNDVGPEIGIEGVTRIASYAGRDTAPAANLEEAALRIRELNEVAFPDEDDAYWRAFAKRTFRPLPDGRWAYDYDPNIGRALVELGPAPDLWPAFRSLSATPTLVIRGATSDLLTAEILEKMKSVLPAIEICEVPKVGHAPMLSEPIAEAALLAFIAKVD